MSRSHVSRCRVGLHLLLLAGGFAVHERTARAAPVPCSTLPNPIVIESGDTQEPLLKALGRKLRDSS
jgi:hypothetical protein